MRAAWRVVKETAVSFFEDEAPRLAASVAFYAALSLAPIVILALHVAGTVWGEEASRNEIVEQIDHLIGTAGATALEDIIEKADDPTGRGAAALLGLATLIFAATAVFAQLQAAMNTIWDVQPEPRKQVWEFLRKRLISLGVLAAVAFLMLVSLVLSSIVSLVMSSVQGSLPRSDSLWSLLDFVSSLVIFFLLFAIIFKVMPDVNVDWRDVWIGAGVTTVLFAVGKEAIGYYVGRSVIGSAYGTAGSLVILLLWVYYSSLIIFLGAEFTQAFAHERGRRIVPERHAAPSEHRKTHEALDRDRSNH